MTERAQIVVASLAAATIMVVTFMVGGTVQQSSHQRTVRSCLAHTANVSDCGYTERHAP